MWPVGPAYGQRERSPSCSYRPTFGFSDCPSLSEELSRSSPCTLWTSSRLICDAKIRRQYGVLMVGLGAPA